jgi:hypothetical protein
MLALLTAFLRLAPAYVPLVLRPWIQPLIIGASMAVGMLDNATTALSKYALVYVGLTGDAFFVAARRAKALTAAVEGASEGKYRRKFKTEREYNALVVSPSLLLTPFLCSTIDTPHYCPTHAEFPVRIDDLFVCCTYTLSSRSSTGRCDSRRGRHRTRRLVLCWPRKGHVSLIFVTMVLRDAEIYKY